MQKKFGAIDNEFLSQESWQVRLQVERVVRNREDRQKTNKTPSLPSSGRTLVNLIWGHTESTIAFSTRWVSTAVKNLTSR